MSEIVAGLTSAFTLANLLVVPAAAWAMAHSLSLEPNLRIGLILFSAVAGAPLALKAAELARGDVHLAVGLVTPQVVATVVFLPFGFGLLMNAPGPPGRRAAV